MLRITYTSTATNVITPQAVIELLDAARRNNSAMGVTGLLYYASGQFAQCLEGEKDAVEAIYAKIEEDKRHYNLVATRQPMLERAFHDWSMAFIDTSTAEVARILINHQTNTYEAQKWQRDQVLPILAAMGEALRIERILVTH